MDDWRNRVGGDSWRNVIRLECEAVTENSNDVSPRPSLASKGGSLPEGPNENAFAYEYVGGKPGDKPLLWSQSYLLWQTGRLFVIGPTTKAADCYLQRNRLHQGHLHVVLLNWHQQHQDGLRSLLKNKWETVTFWTSFWIWEEAVRKNKDLAALSNIEVLPPSLEYLQPNSGKERQEKTVALFERDVVWPLTCGVTLGMSYSVASQPCLRAEFRCNNHKILIDPALDWLLRNPRKDSPVDRFRQLYSDIASVAKEAETEEFSDGILSRRAALAQKYGALVDLKNRPQGNGTKLEISIGDWGLWRTEEPAVSDQPVAIPSTCRDFKARQYKGTEPQPAFLDPDAAPKKSSKVLHKTSIIILCGGLTNKADRALIDPGYGMDIKTSKKEDVKERMSILEWRLHQLNKWVIDKDGPSSFRICLLATPESAEIVETCRAKYQDRFKKSSDNRLKITLFASQLIPRIYEPQDGSSNVTIFQSRDGGWQLLPRGHIDALRLFIAQQPKKQLAIIFALNNLGALIDDNRGDTLDSRLRVFEDSKAEFAVELFPYRQDRDDRDLRWGQLSYWTGTELMKRAYASFKGANEEERHYSSLTWYVNGKQLTDNSVIVEEVLKDIGFLKIARQQSKVTSRVSSVPTQDLDMISHCEGISVKPMDGRTSSEKAAVFAKHPFYNYSRYLGIRTTDQIRHLKFYEEFSKIGQVLIPEANPHASVEQPPPVLIAWPKHREYVWGGMRLRP